MSRKLISSDEARQAAGQHTRPCSDCPWSRQSLNGWLGGESIEAWLAQARSDHSIECHTLHGAQCAGAAIFRANTCKTSRDSAVLSLPADRTRVFASPEEFRGHHSALPGGSRRSQSTPPARRYLSREDWIERLLEIARAHHNESAVRDYEGWSEDWERESPEATYYAEFPEHRRVAGVGA